MSVESIFAAAAQKPSAERAAYLDKACGPDADLRRKVERLLAAHDAAGEFLEAPAFQAGRTTDYQPIAEKPGSMIGPYKLKEQIGEGGFGLVFVAEQQEPVKRKVALKVIKPGMDTREVMARFTAERQALALMDHPNIARVLDAGATDSGRPYFVMELVRGIPITEYCDQNQLPPRDRLDLFVTVCQAIQHAHQKGIIHRDIKPSNVLVTSHDGKPVAKVIDFGVAKAISQQLADRSIYTNFAQMIGTPLYMSPEQAEMSGLDIDTRSDIYSLGVLLYELLTGTTPLDRQSLRQAAYDEVRRLIREEEPPKPSTRLSTSKSIASVAAQRKTEPAKLSKLMRGDLDWITMKALEKDRTRRYETANGFAMDVQRYLAGDTVLAAPPSAVYRFRKFIRRYRGPVVAASLVLTALLTGLIATTYGLYRADREQLRANAAEQTAVQNARLATEAAAAEKQAKLAAEKSAEAESEARKRAVEFRDRALAALRAATGEDVEKLIGAKTQLTANESAYLEAIVRRWQRFAEQEGSDEPSRAIQAEGYDHVAQLWLRLGRHQEARLNCERVIPIYEKLVADFPNTPAYREKLAAALNSLAIMEAARGRHAEARKHYEAALALTEKLSADQPAAEKYRYQIANIRDNLGVLFAQLNQREAARRQFESALSICDRLNADVPDDHKYQKELSRIHNNLGLLYSELDDANEPANRRQALRHQETALAIREKLAAQSPANPEFRLDLAASHHHVAQLSSEFGDLAAALRHCEKAVTIQEALVADFPSVLNYRIDLGAGYAIFGEFVLLNDKPSDALKWIERSVELLKPIHESAPRTEPVRSYLRNNLASRANVLDQLGKHAEAATDWDRAIELSDKSDQPKYRVGRAKSLALAGQTARAVAEATDLRKLTGSGAAHLYDLAAIHGIAARTDQERRALYAEAAIKLLDEAVAAGYSDHARMDKDGAFTSLRDRPEFQKLLEKAAAKPLQKNPARP